MIGIAEARGQLASVGQIADGFRCAGQNRHFCLIGNGPSGRFVAQFVEQFSPRADQFDAGFVAGPPQRRIFRQEAVAGVNAIDFVQLGRGDDAGDIEISPNRLSDLADLIRFVGLEPMQREAILVGIDGDRSDSQFVGGTEDANRNFAAIGNQQLPESVHRWVASIPNKLQKTNLNRPPPAGRPQCQGRAGAPQTVLVYVSAHDSVTACK